MLIPPSGNESVVISYGIVIAKIIFYFKLKGILHQIFLIPGNSAMSGIKISMYVYSAAV